MSRLSPSLTCFFELVSGLLLFSSALLLVSLTSAIENHLRSACDECVIRSSAGAALWLLPLSSTCNVFISLLPFAKAALQLFNLHGCTATCFYSPHSIAH